MLDADSPTTIRLSIIEAQALGCRALTRLGLTPEEAGLVTHHLVDSMLCGYAYAGLARIVTMMADSPEMKNPRQPVRVVHETPISAVLDGGNHMGYVSVYRGVEIGIQKAQAGGVAFIGIHNSWLSGRNAYYLEKAARAGLVGIHTASGPPRVVPPGATRPGLGTNPLAIALPCAPDPLIFDMGTSAMMGAELRLKAFLDEQVPEGTGVDRAGNPTTSAREIVAGGILPFSGHKGYGLSIMIQALDLLAGARTAHGEVQDYGFFFVLFSPSLLLPEGDFATQVQELIAKIKSLPRRSGVDEIRIPSERAFRERLIRTREGVLLDKKVHERLLAY